MAVSGEGFLAGSSFAASLPGTGHHMHSVLAQASSSYIKLMNRVLPSWPHLILTASQKLDSHTA